jgi:hypothetical protein
VIVVLGEGLGDVAEQEISAPVEVIKDQTGRQEAPAPIGCRSGPINAFASADGEHTRQADVDILNVSELVSVRLGF